MNDREALTMPAMRFWLLHRNIDRIAAEEHLRLLDVGIGSQSGEGFKETNKNLRAQMGDVVKYKGALVIGPDEVRLEVEQPDRAGLAMLKLTQHKKVGDRI